MTLPAHLSQVLLFAVLGVAACSKEPAGPETARADASETARDSTAPPTLTLGTWERVDDRNCGSTLRFVTSSRFEVSFWTCESTSEAHGTWSASTDGVTFTEVAGDPLACDLLDRTLTLRPHGDDFELVASAAPEAARHSAYRRRPATAVDSSSRRSD